jgi:hypothetical protein
MYKVTHNTPRKMMRKYQEAIRNYPSQLRDVIDKSGGAFARTPSNHKYENRTYDLQKSTKAYIVSASFGGVEIVLEARMPYAVFVAKAGYLSLSEAGRIARAAVARFHRFLLR